MVPKNKGLALLVVLAFTVITVIAAGTYLAFTNSQVKFNEFQFRRNLANYASNAGLQYGLECLRLDTMGVYGATLAYCITGNSSCPTGFCADVANCAVNVPELKIIENNIPFDVTVRIGSVGEDAGFPDSRPLRSTVEYSLIY